MKQIVFLFALTALLTQLLPGQNEPVSPTEISKAIYFDVYGPIRDIPPLTQEELQQRNDDALLVRNEKLKDRSYPYASIAFPKGPDAVWQKQMGTKSNKGPIINFNGQSTNSTPPDCNGDVGLNYYFQGVNTTYSIYDKTGTQVVSPTAYNSLFAGVPGANHNDGDPIILYDSEADRWFAAEFSGAYSNPDYMLIAVSETGDPTGSWFRWSFVMNGFPDYMKFGIWHDGYYMATNSYGNDVYVFEREVMLAGGSNPQMAGFNNPWRPSTIDGFHCIQPLDNDGNYAPLDSPGLFITIADDAINGGDDELWIYELEADWTTPSNSTFTRIQQIDVSPFDSNFGNTWDNIVQPGTSQKLDAVPQVLMYRAQYRNFGYSQNIVCCHTVDVDQTNHAGIRWYELEKSGNDWSIRQQSTYAPDEHSRWMGSIAMNANHEIALGYSISSSTEYPGIRLCGQSSDENALASGIIDIDEMIIKEGTYSQTFTNRWGDYSLLTVDPTDDLTFWFTTQYMTSGSGKGTKICSFDFEPLQLPTAFAGNDTSVCENSLFDTDATAFYFNSVHWETSGDGMFQDPNILHAKYLRGNGDIENGSVILSLTAYGYETGQEATDDMTLYIIEEPEADAGNDTTIHYNHTAYLNGQTTDYSSVEWTTAGDGTFNNPSVLNAIYSPGTNDISNLEVTLTLTVFAQEPCEGEDSDNMTLTIDPTTGIFNTDISKISVSIVPNPTNGKLKVIVEGGKSGDFMVSISDFIGKVVYEESILSETGSFSKYIDLSNLPKGVYLLKIQSKDVREVNKIVIF